MDANMTCCFAICLPNLTLAAADTRVGINADGRQIMHDGPHPITIESDGSQQPIVLPYRYRKIRKIDTGWAVYAGSYASGTPAVDKLKSQKAILFTQARNSLRSDPELISRLALETGMDKTSLSKTTIIGAPFGHSSRVWTLPLDPLDTSSVNRGAKAGGHAINWPYDVPMNERVSAMGRLHGILRSAGSSIFIYAKAMSDVIATAARHAADAGPYIQLGITIATNSGLPQSYYFEGHTSDLESMDETTFNNRLEIAV
jgi:hypothetical protein